MNKKRAAILVLLIALVAGGIWLWQGQSPAASGPLLLHGNVDIREVELAFRQPGRLARLLFDVGASVKQG